MVGKWDRWMNNLENLAVVETALIDEYRQSLGREILNDLLETYMSDAQARAQSIVQYYQAGDIKDVESEATAMQGAAANVGAQRVAEVAKELQLAAAQNNTPSLKLLVPKLQAEVTLAVGEMQPLLNE